MLYYIVDSKGLVLCKDGGFRGDASTARSYQRLSAARAMATRISKYWGRPVGVRDQDGNEVRDAVD